MPLFPCIFVITVKLLVTAIRHNAKIKGVTQNDVQKKVINLLMTHSNIIVAEDESLMEVVKTVDQFKEILGLGMSKSNTTIAGLGPIAHSDFRILSGKNLNWSEVKFTLLCINL